MWNWKAPCGKERKERGTVKEGKISEIKVESLKDVLMCAVWIIGVKQHHCSTIAASIKHYCSIVTASNLAALLQHETSMQHQIIIIVFLKHHVKDYYSTTTAFLQPCSITTTQDIAVTSKHQCSITATSSQSHFGIQVQWSAASQIPWGVLVVTFGRCPVPESSTSSTTLGSCAVATASPSEIK